MSNAHSIGYLRAILMRGILRRMVYVCVFAAGAIIVFVLLWPLHVRNRREIMDNRRRIERLERHQRGQDFVIRAAVEGGIGPPEEPPPGRREFRIFKGAAGVGVLAVLAGLRRHPRMALAASGAAVATALVVTLSPTPAQGGPEVSGLQPPGPVASYSAPAVTPVSPGRSASATPPRPAPSRAPSTSATPVPSNSVAATPAEPTPSQPLLEVSVSLPPVTATIVVPSLTPPPPTGSLLPTPSITPTTPAPKPTHSQLCLVDLSLPPLLRVCLL